MFFWVVMFGLASTVPFGGGSMRVVMMILWIGTCEVYEGFGVCLNGCVYSWISWDCDVPVFNVVVNRLG